MRDNGSGGQERRAARLVVGIAGGSGAGKTALAQALALALGPGRVLLLEQNWYYRDLSHLKPEIRVAKNFDRLQAFELDLLRRHLLCLRRGQAAWRPSYDFATHTRLAHWHLLAPREVVVVKGLLVLADPALRELLDVRVYVDASRETRLARRLTRDVAERGRTAGFCLEQHQRIVWPMHDLCVEPSRCQAGLVVSGDRIRSDVVAGLVRQVEEGTRWAAGVA